MIKEFQVNNKQEESKIDPIITKYQRSKSHVDENIKQFNSNNRTQTTPRIII